MPVEKFNFVSPGVQVAEIDKSGLPAAAPAVGPAVIGRALQGPGMRPVKLNSTLDLHSIFGAPNPGGESGDTWLAGNRAAPTYGLYAAEAYLRNNGPVTFVRLMGENESGATGDGLAGWTTLNSVGLFVANGVSGSSNGIDQITASLGAVIYTSTGSAACDVKLMSITHAQPATATDTTLILNESSDSKDLKFTAVIENYKGTSHLTATFNFDPDSDIYIRKVLNTNPQYCNDSLYSATDRLNYWLGETFESNIEETVVGERNGAPTALASSSNFAFIFRNTLTGTLADHNDRSSAAAVAKSGYVIAQDLTQDTASYAASGMQKLFRFAATDYRGDWDNRNVKISIANIKGPVNPTVNAYGTFDVFVRNSADTDNSLNIIESFTGLSLDPSAENYIARRIGDKYLSWDATNKVYETYGAYDSVSKYIRMDMVDAVDNGSVNAASLPAGFFGPPRYIGETTSSIAGTATFTGGGVTSATTMTSGSTFASNPYSVANLISGTFGVTVSFPSLVLRQSGSTGVGSVKEAFYGSLSKGTFARRDNTYGEYNRRLSSDLGDAYEAVASVTEASFVFSLDNISGTAANPVYVAGSRAAATSFRGTGTYSTLLDAGINNFTMPMHGGTDGFDVLEPEPFANRLTTGQSDSTSYEYYSLRKAVDTIRDPDVVEHNVCSIPGVSTTGITDYLISMAENRRDTLALIDIQHDYKPRFELTSGDIGTNRTTLPNVSSALTAIKARGFNTSYGAAYYPAVQIRDRERGVRLFVPATVAAMAAYGYTDNVAAPWFAPAGFNRGGLDAASGITATGVSKQLRSQDRDDLYEVNVNPIAQFPQEGVVIFGQKTLQATRSALDRVNVRRLLIFLKKEISRIANSILFEPNVQATWNNFLARVNPFLSDVKGRFGLTDYKVILDETTTTPELIDRNILYARILLKPARAIEFIALDFEIFRTGASFDD